jgi:hypothetical protein
MGWSEILAAAALIVAVASYLLNRRAIQGEAEARKMQAKAQITTSDSPSRSIWGAEVDEQRDDGDRQRHVLELSNVGQAPATGISYWVEDEAGSRFNAPSSWPRNVLMPQERMEISVNLDFLARPDWAQGEMALVVAWNDGSGEHRERFLSLPVDGLGDF